MKENLGRKQVESESGLFKYLKAVGWNKVESLEEKAVTGPIINSCYLASSVSLPNV